MRKSSQTSASVFLKIKNLISENSLVNLMGKENEATKAKWGGDRKSKNQVTTMDLDRPKGKTAQIIADKYGTNVEPTLYSKSRGSKLCRHIKLS